MSEAVKHSRRAALGALATAPALALPAAMAAEPVDPVFAAIERHRVAKAALVLAGSRTAYVIKAAKEDEDAEQEASDAEEEALVELVSAPTTLAGVKVMLEYVAQIDPGESPADLNEFLGHLRSRRRAPRPSPTRRRAPPGGPWSLRRST
jgi:hypothetical protein